MNEFKGFGERLKSAIKDSRYTQKDISEELRINQDTITNYVKEKSLPNIEMLYKLCALLKVSSDWLIFGIESHGKKAKDETTPKNPMTLTDDEKDMVAKFRILEYEDQQDTLDIIDMKYNRQIKKEMSLTSENGGA